MNRQRIIWTLGLAVFLTVAQLPINQTLLEGSRAIFVPEALASHDTPFEIFAGQVNGFYACIHLTFAGTCKQGVIDNSGVPGLTFNNNFIGTSSCSNGETVSEYVSDQYDATGLTGISTPTLMSFTMSAWEDSGGECEMLYGTVTAMVYPSTPTFTCAVVPASATVNPGSNASFSINTTPINGFNSPVTFSSSFSPSSGTLPTVSLVNNGQTPSATTTATVSTTQSTTSATYTITFSGTGGGQSATCNAQFVVNPPQPDFSLVLSPLSRTANIGTDVSFQVFANCTGGLAGPITGLTAATTFQGIPTPALAATTLACGATTTVTVTGTASIPDLQQSTILNTILESVTVTGNASG